MRGRVPVQFRPLRTSTRLGESILGAGIKCRHYSSDGKVFWQSGARECHEVTLYNKPHMRFITGKKSGG